MSSSKKPLKKEGVKSSSKKPLKKRGGTGGTQSALAALNRKNAKTYALAERLQGRLPPRSALSAIYRRLKPPENPPLEKPQSALAALNRKNAKTYALAERLQGRSPPKSALSVIHARTPLENPPLEKPQSAKTVNGDSLMRLIKILHRTKKSKKSKEP